MSSKTTTVNEVQVIDTRFKFVGCDNKCGECRICYQEQMRLDSLYYERYSIKFALEEERAGTDYVEVLDLDDDLPF